VSKHAATVPFITVQLAPSDPRALYRQLYDALRIAILDGRLAAGCQFPASRALARQLGVSRFTVVSAYEQLLAEGFIHGTVGSGTFVSAELPGVGRDRDRADPASAANWRQPHLSHRGLHLAATRLTALPEDGSPRAFRPGQPALDQFPAAIWARIAARLYRHPARALLTYGDIAGYRPLREAIAGYLRGARAVVCDPEQVVIVSGAQQALDLAVRVLLDPGDPAWVEDPGYPGARAALQGAEAMVVPVPVDAEGLDVAKGAHLQPDARLAYVTPSYQYPLGVTMSLARRLALLDWARSVGAWILEDDYDSEFRYAGHPLAALAGLDTGSQVIYMGTFSKVLFPALRLGYLVVPSAVVEAFVRARAVVGRHAPTFEQAVLAEFISGGYFARHIRAMRNLYQERQAVLVESAKSDLQGLLHVPSSGAGMHLIGWLDPGGDDRAAASCAAVLGIEVPPLSQHVLSASVPPGLLLGYAALEPKEIRAGIRVLARALRA
jgi:GntR family transcriptional regulator/MocR family aminotransferase